MPYYCYLTDSEWFIIEPLLHQILPIKKQTRPPNWSKREILDGIFYQLKNGCNWLDLPKDLPPYSTRAVSFSNFSTAKILNEKIHVLIGN
jgi:transposase